MELRVGKKKKKQCQFAASEITGPYQLLATTTKKQAWLLFLAPKQNIPSLSAPVGRCSSVFVAARYRLDGPGIESRYSRDIPRPSRPALEPKKPSAQRVPCHSREVNWPERGVDNPPPSSAEVKDRVEPYRYSPSSPSWSVLG